jgi:hypothetical protein
MEWESPLLDGHPDKGLNWLRAEISSVLDQLIVAYHDQIYISLIPNFLNIFKQVEHVGEVLPRIHLRLENSGPRGIQGQDREVIWLCKLRALTLMELVLGYHQGFAMVQQDMGFILVLKLQQLLINVILPLNESKIHSFGFPL